MPKLKMTQAQIARIPSMAKTMSNRKIAEEFGVTPHWIEKRIDRLRDAGVKIPLRPRGKARKRAL